MPQDRHVGAEDETNNLARLILQIVAQRLALGHVDHGLLGILDGEEGLGQEVLDGCQKCFCLIGAVLLENHVRRVTGAPRCLDGLLNHSKVRLLLWSLRDLRDHVGQMDLGDGRQDSRNVGLVRCLLNQLLGLLCRSHGCREILTHRLKLGDIVQSLRFPPPVFLLLEEILGFCGVLHSLPQLLAQLVGAALNQERPSFVMPKSVLAEYCPRLLRFVQCLPELLPAHIS
mmetsp:Transcript_8033/g.18743  ORF Transcript_8033/g.18743 Transcript_8033/m.18743 type:complete len:229 (-) Transcript_8033:1383-2069(-)